MKSRSLTTSLAIQGAIDRSGGLTSVFRGRSISQPPTVANQPKHGEGLDPSVAVIFHVELWICVMSSQPTPADTQLAAEGHCAALAQSLTGGRGGVQRPSTLGQL